MKAKASRIIYFIKDMTRVSAFYRGVLGLKAKIDPNISAEEWIEFEAGSITIALHKASKATGKALTRTKLVFYAKDVRKVRQQLVRRKAKMGTVHVFGKLVLCDGQDPEGNKFQISNRL